MPMYKNGFCPNGTQSWRCRVKQDAWGFARYHDNPDSLNYSRSRQRLRQRILAKMERIAELEEQLASQIRS